MATASEREGLVVSMGEQMRARPSRLRHLARLARQKPLGAISTVILVALVLTAVFAPFISPYDPLAQSRREALKPPSAQHLLGTDQIGRDVLSRIIWGARTSLYVGLLAVCAGTLTGCLIGLVTGYWGGRLDLVAQRIIDSLMAFPALILTLTIVAMLGQSITVVILSLSVVMLTGPSRIVRGAVLSAKENQYVEAARTIGARDRRIVFRHILPNVLAPIIVVATVGLGGMILAESSMAFLGLGTPPPTPSWGDMLSGSRTSMYTAPWLALAPGIALSISVFSFNLMGDALRDVLDPRLRGSR